MNKKLIIFLSIVIVIILLGSVFSYVLLTNSKNKSFENSSNMKIISFTSSLNPTEVYETPISLPSSNEYQLFYNPPIFNISLYSSSSANMELLITLKNGTTLDLMAEPFIGFVNISYPSTISTMLELIKIFEEPGNYTFTLKVFQNSTVIQKNLTEVVLPAVTISGINGLTKSTVNSSISYTPKSVYGGIPPYKYLWYVGYLNNPYYLNSTGEKLTFTPKKVTNYKISLYVIDNIGRVAFSSITLNVSNKLSASIIYDYDPVDTGVKDNFKAEISGGFPNFTYTWILYPLNITIGNKYSINYTFQIPGNYIIKLIIKDSIDELTNATLNVSVNEYPKIINFTQEYNAIDYYIQNNYYLNLTGGTLNMDSIFLSYYYGSSLISNFTLQNISHNRLNFFSLFTMEFYPPLTNNISVITSNAFIKIRDYGGAILFYNFTLTINPPVNGSIKIFPNTNISINDTVYLNATVDGGTAPYNFTWSILTPNLNQITLYGQYVKIIANQSGTYSIQLKITDKFGTSSIYSYTYIYSYISVG
jgi:hypothetical protein